MKLSAQQKCRLVPYKRRNILTAQEAKQRVGWGISKFDIPLAWSLSRGEGIVVAVIDSGACLKHPDLSNNLLPGYNFIDSTATAEDDCGHGTAVAGIICAEDNDCGIVGVAPKAKVLPIKALDQYGDGEIENVVKSTYCAIDHNVDFIVMSLGCVEPVRSLRRAIKVAEKKGIVIFCAAGNMGTSENLLYPANYPETISVAAIDKSLHRADFNNTGAMLDFCAPGVDILTCSLNNGYSVYSGSSMAGPYVGALAALLKSYARDHRPDLKLNCAKDYRSFFSMHTINVVGPEHAGDRFYQGFGIITLDRLKLKMQEQKLI